MQIQKYFRSLLLLLIELWDLIKCRIRLIWLASKIPGEMAMPFIGNLYWSVWPTSEEIFRFTVGMRKKFGFVYKVFVGPKLLLVTTNHLDDELILTRQDFLEKGLLYSFLKPWLGTGLLISSGEKWRSRRKILTPAFHFKILDQFIPVFNSCGDEFVRLMRQKAGGESFDIWPPVKLLTLDVICETTMGVLMNAQTDSKSEYVNAVNDISHLIYEYVVRPWLYIGFLFNRSELGRRYKACLHILHSTTDRVIKERRAELMKMDAWNTTLDIDDVGLRHRVAFLDLLLLAARDGSLTDADIREEVDTFMFEGHDTTAAAISFTVYLLSLHPDIQEKMLEELETVFDASESLHPSLQQLSELKYIEMVIKESMRIYPPVTAISRQVNFDFKFPSSPWTAPKGAETFMSFYLLHRNPESFPDPESFNPERFTPEENAQRHPFAYLPFSAGPRNCIGQRFAMLEMKCLLSKIIWNFRILPDPNFTPNVIWELILKSKNGLFVKLENRNRSK